jgi:hypothetical protein
MKLLFSLALFLSLALAAFASPALASVDGCDIINDPIYDSVNGLSSGASALEYSGTIYFEAGDFITIVSQEDMTLYLPIGTPVATYQSSGQYEVIRYEVPNSGTYNGFRVETGGKASDYWDLRCERTDADAGQPCAAVLDGRLNNRPDIDCGAPVAAYSGDVIDIYVVNPANGIGNLLYRVDPDTLVAGASNQTLWQGVNPYNGTPVIVSLLSTGEVQVNAFYADWKPYTIAWPANAPQSFYHIAW